MLNCSAKTYNFSLKNTLSIFFLNDGENYYFCIPVQYIGDYHIESFEFDTGYILIGNYEIQLSRDDLNIEVFLNEASDESGKTDGEHKLIYSEKNGRILLSKMDEPLAIKNDPERVFNQYNIILEKYLKNSEIKKITNEYKKGNTQSRFYLEYTITIDNERIPGCGYLDDFELYDGNIQIPFGSLPNLEFFRFKIVRSFIINNNL
jgi:hypothetical protein